MKYLFLFALPCLAGCGMLAPVLQPDVLEHVVKGITKIPTGNPLLDLALDGVGYLALLYMGGKGTARVAQKLKNSKPGEILSSSSKNLAG